MATFTASSLLLPRDDAGSSSIRRGLPTEEWQLAVIEWGGSLETGFVNKTAAIDAVQDIYPALSIFPARIAPDGYKRPKRQGDIESGVVPLQTATIKFQDKGRSLGELIAENRANGIGIRGKILRVYEWQAGEPLDTDEDLIGTYRLEDRSWLDGHRTLTAVDIRRDLKAEIWEPETYRLVSSLAADTVTGLVLESPYPNRGLPYFLHNERYSSDPDEKVLYVKLGSGEIIKLPSFVVIDGLPVSNVVKTGNRYRFGSIGRGALNTSHLVDAVLISIDTETDNLPELQEWIYIEETLPNLISLITTGETLDGRSAASDHHYIRMSPRWLDVDSLLYAAPELATLPLRPENYGSTSVKELIEDEILPFLPGILAVNHRGQIGIRRITKVGKAGGSVYKFDESSIDRSSVSGITSAVAHIRSAVAIKAGWDARTEEFGTPIFLSDAAQAAANDSTKDAEILILESKLFHTSIHTNEQLRRLLPALAEHYLGERLTFSFEVAPSTAIVGVGERVDVHIEGVPDDASSAAGAPDIDRSFVVTSVAPGRTGTVYQVTGTSGLGEAYEEALSASSLDLLEYQRNATPLEDDLPNGAIVLSDGIYYLQPGGYPLKFNTKYVFDKGPLYHTAGSTIICWPGHEGPMFQLWVPYAWHSDSPTTVVTTGSGSTLGGTAGQTGGSGYAIPTVGVGSVNVHGHYDRSEGSGDTQVTAWTYSARPGVRAASYTTGDVPPIALSYNDDQLIGLPADLSGYGGCGGGTTTINSRYRNNVPVSSSVAGGTGVRGSAGVMIICRGASMAPAARFVTDGQDGDDPPTVSMAGDAQSFVGSNFTGAPGSGSGPGTVFIGIDGPFQSFDLASHVEAHPGETDYGTGTRMPTPRHYANRGGFAASQFYSHYLALPHTTNMASACSRLMYLPARATVQERSLDVFSSLAIARQKDGQIKIRTTTSSTLPPSFGLPGDLGIWEVALASTNPAPPAWVMDDDYTWQVIDWTKAAPDYQTLLFVNRNYGGTESVMSLTRPVGKPAGTHWLNQSDGTEWILGASSAEDRPFRDQGVPVGIELISNGNFAEGDQGWIFTRDAALQPVNILNQIAGDIASAFISHGAVEGEYVAPSAEVGGGTSVPQIATLAVPTLQDTSMLITWTQLVDTTGVSGQEVFVNGALVATVAASQYTLTGLTPSTVYTIGVRNIGTSGTRSATTSLTAVTTAIGEPEQPLGISLTHTGQAQVDGTRKVAGTAYQNNASIVIAVGRQIDLTLNNGSVIGPETVGSGGAFTFLVASSHDAQLNKSATIYANNSDDTTKATIPFTYQL